MFPRGAHSFRELTSAHRNRFCCASFRGLQLKPKPSIEIIQIEPLAIGPERGSPMLMSKVSITPLLLRAAECASLCGVSRRTWDRLKSSGKLPPSFKLGNSRVWKRCDLESWIRWNMPCLDKFLELKEMECAK